MKTKIIKRIIQFYAIYLFLSSAFTVISNINIIRTGSKTIGKVTSSYKEFDYSTQTSNKRYGTSHYIHRPIIQYIVNGETYEINGKIHGEMGSEYQLNQSVPLIYLANNPSYGRIDSFLEFWSEPLKMGLYSIIVFLIGTYLGEIFDTIKKKLSQFFQRNFTL